MKILRNKIEFVVLVIILHLNKSHAQSTVQLIPIPESLKFGPKTHERIIVPHFDTKQLSEDNEQQAPSAVKNVVERPNLRGRIQYEGRRNNPRSYVNRHDGRVAKIHDPAPNEMQPLHIDTEVFDNSKPNHTRESKDDKKKRFKLQEERIEMQKLPENPQDIPTTTWFDNLGKYNYGIVHHANNVQEVPELEEVEEQSEGESKEVLLPVILPSQITTTPLPEVKFKSSFRDPQLFSQIHSENDNMGKFLYKTQVYYPNYRDHVYLPITTFYGGNQGLTKDLPVFHAHTIIHNDPQNLNVPQDAVVHQNPNPISPPRNIVSPKSNAKKPLPVPPKKTPPRVDNHKKEVPKKPVIRKPPPPPPKKEEPSAEEDYDYEEEEESDDDYDDGANNDKYRGNSNDNDEDEEEEDEEESEENNRNKNSFTKKDSNESGEDQFDQAWSKFGYGQPNKQSSSESDSYESSESQNQPERIKIVHMKMEVQTTPIKYEEGDFDANEEESMQRDIRSVELLEGKKKPKSDAKRDGAKNQAQHPNAGPDDLKFFQ